MFSTDRRAMRKFFSESWRKYKASEVMEPLELLVAELVADHPEYHQLLASKDALDDDFSIAEGESNPFLHLSMHVALREQAKANRPNGFATAYGQLCSLRGDRHDAEHAMMECLGKVMWEAGRKSTPPDEREFLECVKRMIPFGRA